MKVILLQDIKTLGKKGQVVEASDAYARNVLFAKKQAVEATGKNLNDLKLQNKHADKVAEENLEKAKELAEFLSRQNRNGQKLILPILHNITLAQLQERYPSVADIQAIDSKKYTCDQIAIMFARQLIKRLKSM